METRYIYCPFEQKTTRKSQENDICLSCSKPISDLVLLIHEKGNTERQKRVESTQKTINKIKAKIEESGLTKLPKRVFHSIPNKE